jgi:hypothetical protein
MGSFDFLYLAHASSIVRDHVYSFYVYSILVQVYVIMIAVMLKYTVFCVMTETTAKKLYQFLSKCVRAVVPMSRG